MKYVFLADVSFTRCARKDVSWTSPSVRASRKAREDLTFKDFEDMAGGGVNEQEQVQFLCPKRNHVSANKTFAMRTPQVTKKFLFVY